MIHPLMMLLSLASSAAGAAEPYPTMAAIELYRAPSRDAEIALARSAAPPSLSDDAEILVFGAKGYETAVPGKNGFTCLVERSWGADAKLSPVFGGPLGTEPTSLFIVEVPHWSDGSPGPMEH